jgi:sugar phosphate isomerase/epimerase
MGKEATRPQAPAAGRPAAGRPASASLSRVHIHVPYAKFHSYGKVLRGLGTGVELYIDSRSMDEVTEADLHGVLRALAEDQPLSIHAPFMDLCPGAIDSKVAAASLERYLEVMSAAEVLKPKVIVFHAGYEKWKYAGEVELWLTQSLKTWRAVVGKAEKLDVKVAIENIVDEAPAHLSLLAREMDHPLFGLCLDVGHREIFSSLPIDAWVEGLHPHIFELHLHDNNGQTDEHLVIGEGRVDFKGLFASLKKLSIDPIYTLEAHSEEEALRSLENLKEYL